jgi:hypothetical protein
MYDQKVEFFLNSSIINKMIRILNQDYQDVIAVGKESGTCCLDPNLLTLISKVARDQVFDPSFLIGHILLFNCGIANTELPLLFCERYKITRRCF